MPCKHTEWFSLASQGTSSLVRQTSRLWSLVHSLPSPASQQPSLILLFESRTGRTLTVNEPCTSATPGTVHLRLDSETVSQDNPVLVASAFPVRPKRRIIPRKGRRCCSTVAQHTLPGPPDESESLIYSRLLYPFVDLFCFVYHDGSDVENIVQNIKGCVQARKMSTVQGVLPEILIIIAREGAQQAQVAEELLAKLAGSSLDLVPEYFSGLKFAKIRKDELITDKGRSRLQRHLRNASNRIRHERADRGLLFSANHFLAFAEIAFEQLLLPEPFDFIKTSRLQNPVAADLAQHLTNFVSQVQSAQELTDFAAETIASSFLLDHYPPGMHGTWLSSRART